MEKYLQQTKSDCIKIDLYGPESTRISTLAKQLAEYYKTDFVQEYAREYLQKKYDQFGLICELNDILPIAKGQMNLENNATKNNSLIFCDTNLLTTMVYSKIYFNYCDPILERCARSNFYDIYLLMDIDIPWIKDNLRDRPHERKEMFESFKSSLIKNQKKFEIISGNFKERKEKAIRIINNLFNFKV